jgi:hypothetical protein
MDFIMNFKCQPKSHTHLQFAQANAQTKNCKRVCLANPLKDRLKEQITGHNILGIKAQLGPEKRQ